MTRHDRTRPGRQKGEVHVKTAILSSSVSQHATGGATAGEGRRVSAGVVVSHSLKNLGFGAPGFLGSFPLSLARVGHTSTRTAFARLVC